MPTITATNVQTDATRATATDGDGLSSDSSFGIWEATTNKVIDGGMEGSLHDDWINQGSTLAGTRAFTTEQEKFGSKSFKIVSTGDNGVSDSVTGLTPGAVYTLSAWVYVSAYGSGRSIIMDVQEGGVIDTTGLPVPDATNGGFVRYSETFTYPANGSGTAAVRMFCEPGSDSTVYVDGYQLELGSYATPYVETGGAEATRAASDVTIPSSLLDETEGWMAVRARMNWANTAGPSSNPVLFEWADDANNFLECRFDTSANQWELERKATSATVEGLADTFSKGDTVTVIAAWDATTLKLSVDGSAFSTTSNTLIPTLSEATVNIGSSATPDEHLNADVFWVAGGTGTLTDSIAALFNGFGATDKVVFDFNVGQADPTFFWACATTAYLDTAVSRRGQLGALGAG